MLFPNYSIRYQFPVFWIFYLIFTFKKNISPIIILLTIYNTTQLSYIPTYGIIKEKSEYKIVADWINNQIFDQRTHIFIYDPNILKYFVNDKSVNINTESSIPDNLAYYENKYKKCNNDIICVFKELGIENENIIIISTTESSKEIENMVDKFTPLNNHHILPFQDKHLSADQNFELTDKIGNERNWAKIYKYKNEKNY